MWTVGAFNEILTSLSNILDRNINTELQSNIVAFFSVCLLGIVSTEVVYVD